MMVSKVWNRNRLKIASLIATITLATVGVLVVWWIG